MLFLRGEELLLYIMKVIVLHSWLHTLIPSMDSHFKISSLESVCTLPKVSSKYEKNVKLHDAFLRAWTRICNLKDYEVSFFVTDKSNNSQGFCNEQITNTSGDEHVIIFAEKKIDFTNECASLENKLMILSFLFQDASCFTQYISFRFFPHSYWQSHRNRNGIHLFNGLLLT